MRLSGSGWVVPRAVALPCTGIMEFVLLGSR